MNGADASSRSTMSCSGKVGTGRRGRPIITQPPGSGAQPNGTEVGLDTFRYGDGSVSGCGARVAPDDVLILTLSKEIGAPAVTGSRDTAIRMAHDRAVRPVENAHLIAASLGEEIDGLPLIVIARDERGRVSGRLRLQLSYQRSQPGG